MTKDEHLKLIKTADRAYYDGSRPIMTDAAYDRLRTEYIDTYGVADLDYVPGGTTGRFQKHRFTEPVTSLDKIQMESADWRDVLRAHVERLGTVVVQPKIDGLTMVKVNRLRVSRGSGDVGNVYPNAYHVAMGDDTHEHIVRGEVYLGQADLAEVNATRVDGGLEPYENARNAAAGLLSGTSTDFVDRLSFVAYNLMGVDADLPQSEQLSIIANLGCRVVENLYVGDNPEAVVRVVENFDRTTLPYDVDGLVVKSDERGSATRFGGTGHHPLNAIAVKFETDKALTRVIAVEWSVGRRKVSPIAILEPVRLCGTTVQRAMVHNVGVVTKLGLSVGALVEVEKSNEIIPQVVRVVEPGPAELPVIDACPACGHPLRTSNDTLLCVNEACGGRLARELAHVAAKDCLDIFTLSVGTAEKLVVNLGLTSPSDLFRLTKADLLSVEGFADRSADLLLAGLDRSRTTSLARFIYACCVDGVGSSTARDLARYLGTYEAFLEAIVDHPGRLRAVDGVGDVIVANLTAAVATVKRLRTVVTPEPEVVVNRAPRTWVITGALSRPRDHFAGMIDSIGDKVASSVTAKTDLLLAGEKAGSKLAKAEKLGVRVVSEDEFLDLLNVK